MSKFSASTLCCCLVLALGAPLVGACASMQDDAASDAERATATDTALSAAIAGDWRDHQLFERCNPAFIRPAHW